MKYIVQSTAVWDTIKFPGSEPPMDAPGGAGFYAMAGMKVWEDAVGIVTGVGEDYLEQFKPWYEANSLPTEGMLSKDPHSPRTMVVYDTDGERTEEPFHGIDHYLKIEATPDEVEPFCADAEGVYVFKNLSPAYWEGMLALKKKYGFKLMWEIAADATLPENLEAIKAIAEQTDVFSLNRTEACTMFGVTTVDEVVEKFTSWNIPLIYLRLGSKGTCLIRGSETAFVPSVPNAKVVDATGGGNSSTGGAFIGFCRGLSLREIGAMGNVSASFCIQQWGVPERFDEALRRDAKERMEQVLALCGGEKLC